MKRPHLPIYLALLPTAAYAHGGALAYVAVLTFLYIASVVLAPMVAARGKRLIATIATLIGYPAFFMVAQWVTGAMHGGGRDAENALVWTMYLAAPLWLAIVFRASRRPRKRNTASLKTAQANSTIGGFGAGLIGALLVTGPHFQDWSPFVSICAVAGITAAGSFLGYLAPLGYIRDRSVKHGSE